MGEGSTLIDPKGPQSPDDNCWGGSPDLPQVNKEKILRHRLGHTDLSDQAENVTFVLTLMYLHTHLYNQTLY